MGQQPVISLRGVSKKYRLFTSPAQRLREALHPLRKRYHEEFWALKDITLDVNRRETVGILGLNGSGKSTLLQLICSVLRPTQGTVEVSGRISALLELGVGFNPALTGKQNVDLHCTLLGMSKQEIAKRLPEIEEFADIGLFFEQPVRNYSSGMFVRLAFSAAMHVDPDILVLDEVIAVGDARFQHKCFQKLQDFQKKGKTILLVTHNPDQVARHCNRGIVLHQGRMVVDADSAEAINEYYKLLFPPKPMPGPTGIQERERDQSVQDNGSLPAGLFNLGNPEDLMSFRPNYNAGETRFGNDGARILDAAVIAGSQANVATVQSGERIDIYLRVWFKIAVSQPEYAVKVNTVDGVMIYATSSKSLGQPVTPVEPGDEMVARLSLSLPIQSGDIFIDLAVACMEDSRETVLDARASVIHLTIGGVRGFWGLVNLAAEFDEVRRGRVMDATIAPGADRMLP
jgi:lipopolysaccharide transport system ATP-binding protein